MYGIANKINPKLRWSDLKNKYTPDFPYYLVFTKKDAELRAPEVDGVVFEEEIELSPPIIEI